jgi:hypothetical protein
MSKSCGQAWKVDALEDGSLSASDAESFERHSRICRECHDRVRVDGRLRRFLKELPDVSPLDLPFRRLRARILSDAREEATRQPRPRWPALVFAAVALAVLTTLAVASGLRFHPRVSPPEDPFAGSVTAVPGAEWVQARHERVETVRLTKGELWIVVRKQTQGERFLVVTPDGELEVRGTTFDIVVDGYSTRYVHVVEGRVAVRLRNRPALELTDGGTWDRDALEASTSAAVAAPIPASVPVALAESSTPREEGLRPLVTSPPAGDDGSAAYEAAMKLYLSAHFAEAAEAFRQFEVRYRHSSFLEDATFLEALSLTKAGHADAGALVASRHLAEFPRSFHAKEASVLVARAARDRGDCEVARASLAPWRNADADSTSREALGACAAP